MKKIIASLCTVLICSTCFAQSLMTPFKNQSNLESFFSYNQKTGISDYDAQGYLTISFIVQVVEIKKEKTMTNRTYVRIADCQKNSGQVSIDWLDGNRRMIIPWVSGGKSFTDVVADQFCSIAKDNHIY